MGILIIATEIIVIMELQCNFMLKLRHVFSVEGQSESMKWCLGSAPWLQGLSDSLRILVLLTI